MAKSESKSKPGKAVKVAPAARGLLRPDLERFFDDFMGKNWMRPWSWEFPDIESQMPRVDVIDREDEVVVKAELPGINKEDIEVNVTDSTLTIKGSSKKEEEEEKGDYHRREISSSYVSRTVQLPAEVEGENAKATLKDGVLEVTLHKVEKSKQKRITIES